MPKEETVRPVAPREDEKARVFATAIIEVAKRLGITFATSSNDRTRSVAVAAGVQPR